ncbi:hypothetical protein BaRGS_00037396 [Batillaria attramentaria]|uniref:Uncharacterized protein n=1 Tax=Batillaria attramentaria TaxID=370345 RepID=A0ABD0J970_9CAEN
MSPTTRSMLAFLKTSLEEISRKQDPIQVTFLTDRPKLPIWRKVLQTRYAGEFRPSGIYCVWEDYGPKHKPFDGTISADDNCLPQPFTRQRLDYMARGRNC